jgi:hypothetical protein
MDDSATLSLAIERASLYQCWQLFWFAIHYLAGLLAVLAGGFATAATAAVSKGENRKPGFIQRYAWVWGLAAALLSSVITFLEPLQKAQTYKRAAYELDTAIAEYKDQISDLSELRATLRRAQNLVLNSGSSEEPPSQPTAPEEPEAPVTE